MTTLKSPAEGVSYKLIFCCVFFTFICQCIASISLKYNQQDAKFSRSIYFYKLLYMFQAIPPPIIRSTKLYIQRQVLSNKYCCLLLSWMGWRGASDSIVFKIPDSAREVLSSWWWAEEMPETCRAIYRNQYIKKTLHLVGCTLEMFCCVLTYHIKCCYCSVFHVTIRILDTNKVALKLLSSMYETTPTKTSLLQYFFEPAPFLEVAMQPRVLLRLRVTPYHFVRAEELL
jgi:hypothetical protein